MAENYDDETIHFIWVVQQHPELYNKTDENFMKPVVKDASWKAIGDEFGWGNMHTHSHNK